MKTHTHYTIPIAMAPWLRRGAVALAALLALLAVSFGLSYAQMIGGRYFNVTLDWNKKDGNPLYAPGKAQPKKPSEYKIVGQPIKRADVAPKVFAIENFVTDVKVPGMVHGRMIRPAVAGSVRGMRALRWRVG